MTEDTNLLAALAKWLAVAMATILAWLHRGHDRKLTDYNERIQMLELTRFNKDDADEQRAAMREELRDFRREINARVDQLFNRISELNQHRDPPGWAR